MANTSIDKYKAEFDKAIAFLEKEISKIRTGRASPSLVEDMVVDCFGTKFPLKQLAAISSPEPKQIVIQPWDKSYFEGIQNALSNSSLGIAPIVDKDVIRLTLPQLSEEYRKNLVKMLSTIQEDVRKTVRHFREKCWQEIQAAEKAAEIREDDKFRLKDELQEMVEEYNKKIEKIVENKEKEILE